MSTATIDRVLVALADPTRRAVLDDLGRRRSSSATELAERLPVSRQAVLKHLGVLRDARLVSSAKSGREVLFEVRTEQLVQTAAWMTSLAAAWDDRLGDLKRRAEAL
ncbi:MAG: ArsR/SmtB family transcription factor [Jatrophihabitans sp.]